MREIKSWKSFLEKIDTIETAEKEFHVTESTDRDKYESVIFLQGDEAEEALKILNDEGEDAALVHLKQWHDYGNHEGSDELSGGASDQTYEKDGYIMSWNNRIGYIGLEYDLNYKG